MPRLIDADALVESNGEWIEHYGYDGLLDESNVVFVNDINDAPTIDAEPVVRCKECIFCSGDEILADGLTFCKAWGQITSTEGYCFRGAKMDGGADNA